MLPTSCEASNLSAIPHFEVLKANSGSASPKILALNLQIYREGPENRKIGAVAGNNMRYLVAS